VKWVTVRRGQCDDDEPAAVVTPTDHCPAVCWRHPTTHHVHSSQPTAAGQLSRVS